MVSAAAVWAADWSIGGASVEAGRLQATRVNPNITATITKKDLFDDIPFIPFKSMRGYCTNPII